MVDVFEPMIDGLDKIEQKRRVTTLRTVLSKKEPETIKIVGYQKPEPKEERPPKEKQER